MSDPLDLRQIEKKAFRTTWEDGLLDINFGGIVASFALLAILPAEDTFRFLRYVLFTVCAVGSMLIYQLGKKYITQPRIGQVTFGAMRKRRKAVLGVVLGGIVGLQVLIVLFSVLLMNNPGLAGQLGLPNAGQDFERLLVAVIGTLFVGPSLTLMAYFSDWSRGYYIAVLMSVAVFLLIWFDNYWFLMAAAALIIIPGVVLFIRFLRKYPLPPAEVPHGG